MLQVHVHTACPCPRCMSMSILHVQVNGACPCSCPCCMLMSMLHVHVHAHVHAACPCPCCMSMSMLHVHVHAVRPCSCWCCMSTVCPSCICPCLCSVSTNMLLADVLPSPRQTRSVHGRVTIGRDGKVPFGWLVASEGRRSWGPEKCTKTPKINSNRTSELRESI